MKYAFIFPGQGSQVVGMANEVMHTSIGKTLFEEAHDRLNFDLLKLCNDGPQDKLTQTAHAQPAILTISTIYFKLFQQQFDIQPAFLAGHSLGEYSALVAAQSLDFGDAVYAVHKRGQFMQEAVPQGIGSMAAILGSNDQDIEALCQEQSTINSIVSPANYNTAGQVVIAGHKEAVEKVLSKCNGKLLDVSAPFHTTLMQPVCKKLEEELNAITIKNPNCPVISNCDNAKLTQKEHIIENLISQVVSPVRWSSGIIKMIENGCDHFIEFGHGKILTNMLKRIDKSVKRVNINSLESINTFH